MIELHVVDLFWHSGKPPDTMSIFPEPMRDWLIEHKNDISAYGIFFTPSEEMDIEFFTVWNAGNYSRIRLEFNNAEDEMYFKLAFI